MLKSHGAYYLWRYYKIHDPFAAEVYAIDFWLFVLMSGAALLVPLVIYIFTRKKNRSRK